MGSLAFCLGCGVLRGPSKPGGSHPVPGRSRDTGRNISPPLPLRGRTVERAAQRNGACLRVASRSGQHPVGTWPTRGSSCGLRIGSPSCTWERSRPSAVWSSIRPSSERLRVRGSSAMAERTVSSVRSGPTACHEYGGFRHRHGPRGQQRRWSRPGEPRLFKFEGDSFVNPDTGNSYHGLVQLEPLSAHGSTILRQSDFSRCLVQAELDELAQIRGAIDRRRPSLPCILGRTTPRTLSSVTVCASCTIRRRTTGQGT